MYSLVLQGRIFMVAEYHFIRTHYNFDIASIFWIITVISNLFLKVNHGWQSKMAE